MKPPASEALLQFDEKRIFYLKLKLKFNMKNNIIFFGIDSLRSDHLSCYGYNRNTSPHIDKLAKA